MPGEGESSFFFFTYLFSTALCAIIFVVARLSGKKAVIVKAERSGLKVNAPAIAVCNGVCFLAVSLLTGHMNAAAEFTVITSMSIIVSLAVGCIRLKEKLVRREVISLVFCAAAIICQYWNLI